MWLSSALSQMDAWFNDHHPLSDLVIGVLAIIVWEVLRLFADVIRTPRGRPRQLRGSWSGSGTDVYVANGDATIQFRITLDIHLRLSNITAKAILFLDGQEVERLRLSGGFYENRFLRLSYYNRDKTQQGTLFLEFSSNNDTLSGTFAGFSPRRETLVAGRVALERAGKQ